MRNHQTCSRIRFIPPCLLTVFYHIVLVRGSIIIYNIGVPVLTHRAQTVNGNIFIGQHDRRQPSAHHFLVSSIAHRTEAIAAVGATRHEVEVAHTKKSVVVDVVEVWESQAVGELMAECADAVNLARGGQFISTGIDVDDNTVNRQWQSCLLQSPHVGPDVVRNISIGLTLACIEHEDLVHLAVAVPIIVGEVDISIGGPANFGNHLLGMHIVTILIVLTVVLVVFLGNIGTHNIKHQFKQSCRLVAEIVGDAAPKAFGRGVPRCVQYIVVFQPIVCTFEFLIGKLG